MRIALMITRSDVIGGAQVHVCELAKALQSDAHDVIVLAGSQGILSERLERLGIKCRPITHLVRPISPCNDCRAFFETRIVLRELKPDLVSVHSSKAGIVGRLAAYSLGLPTVFTVHGWAFIEGIHAGASSLYRMIERLCARFTDKTITVSDYDRQLALRYRVMPASKMTTVYNGVPGIPSALRADPSIQPPFLLMVARFEEPKDHASVLKALAATECGQWSMGFVGDGSLRSGIEDLASGLGIADRVCFLGSREDVAEHLAGAQIFVLMSKREALPLSILEAMRAGLPVVACDVGGIKEAVVDGLTGFLVSKGDVSALGTRLELLIGDPALRTKMGAAGRRRYQKMFTLEQMLENTVGVYREALRLHKERLGQ